MPREPVRGDSKEGERPDWGSALYLGAAALLQVVAGIYIGFTFSPWGWLVTVGMFAIAAFLARRAWQSLQP
jgi:hypothetical protein